MTVLAEIAPRVALARDQWLAEQARQAAAREQAARARAAAEARVAHKQWLVEHRELQLLRACASRRRGWIAARARKLDQARRELALAQTLCNERALA